MMEHELNSADEPADFRLDQAIRAVLSEPAPREVCARTIEKAAAWMHAAASGNPRKRRRKWWALSSAAALFLLAVGVGAYFLFGSHPPPLDRADMPLNAGAPLPSETDTMAEPPPSPIRIPGQFKAGIQSHWIAPYVRETTRHIGASRSMSVVWFTPEGKVKRELVGSTENQTELHSSAGFVEEFRRGLPTKVYGTNADWELTLPDKPHHGNVGEVMGTADSRVLVCESGEKEGEIGADIYVLGKLAGTIGPFVQNNTEHVKIGLDGSLAVVVWKDRDQKTGQIVAAGPDGKERFRVAIDERVTNPTPAPGGSAVLVTPNGERYGKEFILYDKSGKVTTLNVSPNALALAWLPGTTTALMTTSIGDDYRYLLIDWQTGKRLWDVAEPTPQPVKAALPPMVALTKDYVLLGQIEYAAPTDKEGARNFYALDIKTGNVFAHWIATGKAPPSQYETFFSLGSRLFFMTDDDVSEIDLNDVGASQHGWKKEMRPDR